MKAYALRVEFRIRSETSRIDRFGKLDRVSRTRGEVVNPDLTEATVALLDHQVIAERIYTFHRDAITLRQKVLPVRPRGIADRGADDAKCPGVVVGADVERIVVLSRVMREIVFHALDAREHGLKLLIRTVGADVPDLGGQRAADVDQKVLAAGRFLQCEGV